MYRPNIVPINPSDLPGFLTQEFLNLQRALYEAQPYAFLEPQAAPPKKTMEGMFVLADGTSWNPGSGAGAYRFQNGIWNFVG